MYRPISSSTKFQREFDNSMTELAKRMAEGHAHLFPKLNPKEDPRNRSLAAHIISLNNGKGLRWWRKNPAAVERLVAMVGISKDDLNLDQRVGPHIFRFPMFQDLPGLEIECEQRYLIAHAEPTGQDGVSYYNLDYWFGKDERGASRRKPDWLYVPDELEFELLSRTIKSPLGESAKSISLEELVEHASDYIRPFHPLVIIVSAAPKAESLYRLLDYAENASLLLISRYPLPGPERVASTSEDSSRPMYYRQKIDSWTWQFLPDWRERLVDWVTRRLGDAAHFSGEAFKAWLREFDPAHVWVTQSSDVMHLCQVANDEFYSTFQQLSRGDDDPELFEHSLGPHRLKRLRLLVESRWKLLGRPWEGVLSEVEWTAIGDRIVSFETMQRDQLVVRVGDGFGFAQPVLARLLLKTLLTLKIRNGALLDWSAACFDQQRRPLLDAVLETFKDEDLRQLAEKVEHENTHRLLSGAMEALFVSSGKRVNRNPALAPGLSSIARRVFTTIDPHDQAPRPWSRPITTPEHGYEWFAACWSWSLHVPRPTDSSIRWSLPGWDQQIPKQVAEWLNPRPGFNPPASWSSPHPPWQDLLPVIERWVRTCTTPPAVADSATMFYPAMLANAARGRWQVKLSWWYGTIGTTWAEHALLTLLQTEQDGGVPEAAALTLWPSMIRHQMDMLNQGFGGRWAGGRLATSDPLSPLFSPVVAAITEALEHCPEKALTDLDKEELQFLQDYPGWLSAPLKRALLELRARALPFPPQAFPMFHFFSAYGPDAAPSLQLFLNDEQLGTEAAHRLWEWAPDIAQRVLDDRSFAHEIGVQHLLITAPPKAVPSVVAALRHHPKLLQSPDVLNWMRSTLPDAGAHAQELLELASQ